MGVFFTYQNNAFAVIPPNRLFNRGVYAITAGNDNRIYGAYQKSMGA